MAPTKMFSKRPPPAWYEKPPTKRRRCGATSMEERAKGQSYIPLGAKLKRTDVQAKKAYISSRCDVISGLSVESCLGLQVPTARGESTYSFRDLRYDLRKGLIAIQTADLAQESMPLVVDNAIPPDNQAIQEDHLGVAVVQEQALNAIPPDNQAIQEDHLGVAVVQEQALNAIPPDNQAIQEDHLGVAVIQEQALNAITPDNQAIQEDHLGVAVVQEQALVPPNDMQDVLATHMSERILLCMAIVHGLLIQRRSATNYPAQVCMLLFALIALGVVMVIMGMAGANAENLVHVYKRMFILYMLLDFQSVVLEGSGLCVGCAT